jgi:hypothetical protein
MIACLLEDCGIDREELSARIASVIQDLTPLVNSGHRPVAIDSGTLILTTEVLYARGERFQISPAVRCYLRDGKECAEMLEIRQARAERRR